MVFDGVNASRVFLDPFFRSNALPYTPTRCNLLTMLPKKKGCSLVFVSHNETCLNTILNGPSKEVIQLKPPDARLIISTLEGGVKGPDGSQRMQPSILPEIVSLLAPNLVSVSQAIQLVTCGIQTDLSLTYKAEVTASKQELVGHLRN